MAIKNGADDMVRREAMEVARQQGGLTSDGGGRPTADEFSTLKDFGGEYAGGLAHGESPEGAHNDHDRTWGMPRNFGPEDNVSREHGSAFFGYELL